MSDQQELFPDNAPEERERHLAAAARQALRKLCGYSRRIQDRAALKQILADVYRLAVDLRDRSSE
jgi:hypothetical protein